MSEKPDWEHDKLWKRIYMRLAKQRQRGTFRGDVYGEALRIWQLTKELEPVKQVCSQGQPVKPDGRANEDYSTFVHLKQLVKDEQDNTTHIVTNPTNPSNPQEQHPKVDVHAKKEKASELPDADEW